MLPNWSLTHLCRQRWSPGPRGPQMESLEQDRGRETPGSPGAAWGRPCPVQQRLPSLLPSLRARIPVAPEDCAVGPAGRTDICSES